jgi:O-methyltransferase
MLDIFVQEIVRKSIGGDVVECGVWRGGSSIAMAASLSERDTSEVEARRKVWLFDSFSGVPKTSDEAPDYDPVKGWAPNRYAASLSEVQENFRRFSLDDLSVFVPGKFEDTMNNEKKSSTRRLPASISLLRIDVDSYEGTKLVLENMYSLVSKGGFIVVDDFHLRGCRTAVHEFRTKISASLRQPLMFTPIDHINTCDMDEERIKTGLNESLFGGDLDGHFRSGPQVAYWRKE